MRVPPPGVPLAALVLLATALVGGAGVAQADATDATAGAGDGTSADYRTVASTADPGPVAIASQGAASDGPNVTITDRHDPPWDGSGRLTVRITGTASGVDAEQNATVAVDGARSFAVALEPTDDGDVATFAFDATLDRRGSTVEVRVETAGGADADTLALDGDGLADAYERRATGTDPLDPDSDAPATDANEADDGVLDGTEDFDGDGLNTYREREVGADPLVADTDADGLDDAFETLRAGTDPRVADSDGDGTPDAREDHDADGLTNAEEGRRGTDPRSADGDDDSLRDAEEIGMGTDPTARDTDGDGITDGRELEAPYHTDPLDPDTDGDGVPDGQRPYPVPLTDRSLDASAEVPGSLGEGSSVPIRGVDRPYLVNSGTKAAAVSRIVQVGAGEPIDRATVTLEYNPRAVDDPAYVAMFRYDPEIQTFVVLESTVDVDAKTVSATTTRPGAYVAFDARVWASLFAGPLPEPGREITFDEDDVTCEGSGQCGVKDGAVYVGEPPTDRPDGPVSTEAPPTPRYPRPPTTVVGAGHGGRTTEVGDGSDGGGWLPIDWLDGFGAWVDSWWPG